jgi:hypothetical protein
MASLLAEAHHLAQRIPREVPLAALTPGDPSARPGELATPYDGACVDIDGVGAAAVDPFADIWLAAPVPADGAPGAPPCALLLPAHRLLLAARCPYFAAATSERWGDAAGDGGGAGGRALQTLVLPDADADVAWELLRFLYTGEQPFSSCLWHAWADGPASQPSRTDSRVPQHGLGEPKGGGDAAATGPCAVCRAARGAARLAHCAEVLLLPQLAAACETALRRRLLAPLPAACLAALLQGCADLGLAAMAEAVFDRLVDCQLRGGEFDLVCLVMVCGP